MNILAIIGSPRKGGNTDILVDTLLDAAGSAYQVEKHYLYDKRIIGCTDCRACKRGMHECVMNDDMKHLYADIDRADVIILGTPVYWLGPTGHMKLFIDRLRPYFGNKKFRGKQVILVAPAGDGPKDCDLLEGMIRRSCGFLDARFVGAVKAKGYDVGDVRKDAAGMARAVELGRLIGR